MEFIFQLLFEFLLQFLIEGVFDLTFGRVGEKRPWLRTFMFLFIGAILGAISIAIVREHFIKDLTARYTAVIVIPVLIGLIMAQIGKRRRKRGKQPNSLEYFFSSWAFALAFGAMRVGFAK